jgi:5-methylcytosine-specific restriction endonuclease McrA
LDGDTQNGAEWNLAVLCQVCHLSVQGRVTMRQLFMLVHTPWMRPHVEGMLREAASAEA